MDITIRNFIALLVLTFFVADAFANGRGSSYGGYNGNTYYGYGGSSIHRKKATTSTRYQYNRYGRVQGMSSRGYSKNRTMEEIKTIGYKTPPYTSIVYPQHVNHFNGPVINSPNSNGSNNYSSSDNDSKQTPKQCHDSCIEKFGELYKWADRLSPLSAAGVISTVVLDMLAIGGEDSFKRRGLYLIHDRDPKKRAKGRLFLSWSGLISGLSKVSLHVGVLAAASQVSMYSYCRFYKCSEKGNSTAKHQASNKRYTNYRHRR